MSGSCNPETHAWEFSAMRPLSLHCKTILRPSACCRELVKAAFDRRPEWQVTVRSAVDIHETHDEDILFFWGEYEGIDWENVHAGEDGHSMKISSQVQLDSFRRCFTRLSNMYATAMAAAA